jgi:hypothetical protein
MKSRSAVFHTGSRPGSLLACLAARFLPEPSVRLFAAVVFLTVGTQLHMHAFAAAVSVLIFPPGSRPNATVSRCPVYVLSYSASPFWPT